MESSEEIIITLKTSLSAVDGSLQACVRTTAGRQPGHFLHKTFRGRLRCLGVPATRVSKQHTRPKSSFPISHNLMVSLLWLGVGVHEWRYLLLTLAVLPASRPLVFDSRQSRWLDEIATARRSKLPHNLQANQPHVYITLLTAQHQVNVSPLGTDPWYFLGPQVICPQHPNTPQSGHPSDHRN